jgi:hypothetical protein
METIATTSPGTTTEALEKALTRAKQHIALITSDHGKAHLQSIMEQMDTLTGEVMDNETLLPHEREARRQQYRGLYTLLQSQDHQFQTALGVLVAGKSLPPEMHQYYKRESPEESTQLNREESNPFSMVLKKPDEPIFPTS